ncbi:MAG: HAD hydrolase family protein [Lachnospiraceae bacterium]|nr:HAD hydrolase family protein [Lachnospiraceae bacterium]
MNGDSGNGAALEQAQQEYRAGTIGNAIPEVKAAADVVIGSNDEDGIAQWLEPQMGKNGYEEQWER